MTDRDKSSEALSSENFLERWSRKKAEAERETPASPDAPASAPAEAEVKTEAKAPASPAPTLEFDLASLPSLDSITAATDIRAFLAPGVPKELARAALRRAWTADPAIRDFVGLSENAWDFTKPDAMAGFGDLPADFDIKKLVAQIFGESEKGVTADAPTDDPAMPKPAEAEEIASPAEPNANAPAAPAVEQQVVSVQPVSGFVQRDNIGATHNSNSVDKTEEHKNRSQHGGALPQ